MKSSAAHASSADGPFARLLASAGPLVLDGAMGTELERRGVSTALPLWSAQALISAPDTVAQIHRDHLDAGADIITTDTFRTTKRTFTRAGAGDRSEELTQTAVSLARKARDSRAGSHALVAGSMAPLEDCYRPDLVPGEPALGEEHRLHARRLANAGVDLLILETMGTIREVRAAAAAARATGLEFIASFICTGEGLLYGGERVEEAVRAIAGLAPAAFAINCVSPRFIAAGFTALRTALESVPGAAEIPAGLYANVGAPGAERNEIFNVEIPPAEYGVYAKQWRDEGGAFVGGCCGTTPEHIREVASAFGRKAARGIPHAT